MSGQWICFNGEWQDSAGRPIETAPMQLNREDKRVPIAVYLEGYKEYSAQYGTGQSAERMMQRGGFSATELAILLYERIKRLEQTARPEALQKRDAGGAVLLALVGLKLYKDAVGKDAHYEAEQPKAWALAKEYLQQAMPEEYAMVEAALSMRSPLAEKRGG